jgi:hypothetical protein
MVIFFDKTTKAIHHTEDLTMTPTLPMGTWDEKKAILALTNLDFVCIPQEMGAYIHHYNLCFDPSGLMFIGIQPKPTT